MVNLDFSLIYALAVFVGSCLVYLVLNFPKTKKNVRIGFLLYAFIRDIDKLLTNKVLNDWNDLPLPRKLDFLKAIYDTIDNLDAINVEQKTLLSDNVDNTLDEFIHKGRQ
jgi:hypothetical protein